MSLALGIFGGTFDPIHRGHVECARELQQRLGFNRLDLLPCHLPAHRSTPSSTSEHRLAMAQLAVEPLSGLGVDDRELRRGGPSYTADTLAEVRGELGDQASLTFVMGSDAYNSLHQWVRWQSLFEFANVLVMGRDGVAVEPDAAVMAYTEPRRMDAAELISKPSGAFAHITLQPWPQSATEVRRRLEAGEPLSGWLPEAVLDYISKHRLYC
ncbi:nicotinate-nucleotide adenylyltransferase [Litorivivens lipolytica]|uniref:Probable nicotinate-nucleotide adenylyltransferase n=1 Tax=Litorivivens lipolytica TaxID=1524264 RepID=A0A7W4W4J2_9GAMM|nr:nicotinate-nucleotide adenylyltransferase [Litorivivens lipolytica]MBB3047190.1 nicotinate-nucleotide adenylyltransferase [Litorivivens lipolytica]